MCITEKEGNSPRILATVTRLAGWSEQLVQVTDTSSRTIYPLLWTSAELVSRVNVYVLDIES